MLHWKSCEKLTVTNKNFVSAFVNKAYQLIKCQMMRVDTLLIEMKYIAM